jgi:hypothetical protein
MTPCIHVFPSHYQRHPAVACAARYLISLCVACVCRQPHNGHLSSSIECKEHIHRVRWRNEAAMRTAPASLVPVMIRLIPMTKTR